jgi:hypothetical protein
MPEAPTRPDDMTEPARATDPASEPVHSPTLEDEFLQTACTIARGRTTWTPGPGHGAEDLPWLKGAAAA